MENTWFQPTSGAISRIYGGAKPTADFLPLVEVCALRALNDSRHVVTISDGGFHVKAVCAASDTSPLFSMLVAGKVPQNCMLRLTQWAVVEGGRAPALILAAADVLGMVPEIDRANMRLLRPWGAKAAELAASQDVAPSFTGAGSSYTTPEKRAGGSTASGILSPPPISNPFPRRLDSLGSRGFESTGTKEADCNQLVALPHGDIVNDADADADAPTQPSVFPPVAANAHATSNPYSAAGGQPAVAAWGGGVPAGGIQMSPLTQHPAMTTSTNFGLMGPAQGRFGPGSGTGSMTWNKTITETGGGFGAGVSPAVPAAASAAASNPYSQAAAAPTAQGGGSASCFQSPPPAAQQAQRPPGFDGFASPAQGGGAASCFQSPPPAAQQAQRPPGFDGFASPARGGGIASYFQSPPPAAQQAQHPPGFEGFASPARPLQPPGFGSLATFAATSGPITPITELSPYGNARWRIKARVTSKRDIRRFSNSRGDGQVFSIELMDKSGGECTATFFGKAVDLFHGLLVQGQVYSFTKGRLKAANRQYDKGEFALTFDEHSLIEAADSDDPDIPGVRYNFQSFAEIAGPSVMVGTMVDVMGVVCDVREVASITVKSSGSERQKREIVLWDGSGPDASQTLDMTIWGDRSVDDYELGTVVFVKSARVNEWNGNKSVNFSGTLERNPDDRRAFELLARYKANGSAQVQPRAARAGGGVKKTLCAIREEDLHLGPPAAPGQVLDPNGPRSANRHLANATVISQIHHSDRPPFYYSCPAEVSRGATGKLDQCRKKASPLGDATPERGQRWRCGAGHECQQPKARFLYRADVADHTGSMEVNLFDEVGQSFFGCDADAFARIWEDPLREDEVHSLTKAATWRRVSLVMRSRKEVWNDTEQTKTTAESASSITFVKDAMSMLTDIHSALGV